MARPAGTPRRFSGGSGASSTSSPAGPGSRRGRRDPDAVRIGDTLDFWRVEAYEPDHLLRLRAEMRVPGRAWLQFEVQPCDAATSRVTQTAIFEPVGVLGLLYWYCLWPFHHVIFGGMLRNLALAMDAAAGRPGSD